MTIARQLILASGSAIRAQLLTRARVEFTVERPTVDEGELKAQSKALSPAELARELAIAKALSVSTRRSDAMVVGADQVLNFEGKVHDKPTTREDARKQLLRFRGKTHTLETTACCCRGNNKLWSEHTSAKLTMREFSDHFLDTYLDLIGDDVLTSVGGYKLEERGIQLFSRVEGDYFSILGLPLLSLLDFLRTEGIIAT